MFANILKILTPNKKYMKITINNRFLMFYKVEICVYKLENKFLIDIIYPNNFDYIC